MRNSSENVPQVVQPADALLGNRFIATERLAHQTPAGSTTCGTERAARFSLFQSVARDMSNSLKAEIRFSIGRKVCGDALFERRIIGMPVWECQRATPMTFGHYKQDRSIVELVAIKSDIGC